MDMGTHVDMVLKNMVSEDGNKMHIKARTIINIVGLFAILYCFASCGSNTSNNTEDNKPVPLYPDFSSESVSNTYDEDVSIEEETPREPVRFTCNICGGTRTCTLCYGTSRCNVCGGGGLLYRSGDMVDCTNCGGSGACPACNGSGACFACEGKGFQELEDF